MTIASTPKVLRVLSAMTLICFMGNSVFYGAPSAWADGLIPGADQNTQLQGSARTPDAILGSADEWDTVTVNNSSVPQSDTQYYDSGKLKSKKDTKTGAVTEFADDVQGKILRIRNQDGSVDEVKRWNADGKMEYVERLDKEGALYSTMTYSYKPSGVGEEVGIKVLDSVFNQNFTYYRGADGQMTLKNISFQSFSSSTAASTAIVDYANGITLGSVSLPVLQGQTGATSGSGGAAGFGALAALVSDGNGGCFPSDAVWSFTFAQSGKVEASVKYPNSPYLYLSNLQNTTWNPVTGLIQTSYSTIGTPNVFNLEFQLSAGASSLMPQRISSIVVKFKEGRTDQYTGLDRVASGVAKAYLDTRGIITRMALEAVDTSNSRVADDRQYEFKTYVVAGVKRIVLTGVTITGRRPLNFGGDFKYTSDSMFLEDANGLVLDNGSLLIKKSRVTILDSTAVQKAFGSLPREGTAELEYEKQMVRGFPLNQYRKTSCTIHQSGAGSVSFAGVMDAQWSKYEQTSRYDYVYGYQSENMNEFKNLPEFNMWVQEKSSTPRTKFSDVVQYENGMTLKISKDYKSDIKYLSASSGGKASWAYSLLTNTQTTDTYLKNSLLSSVTITTYNEKSSGYGMITTFINETHNDNKVTGVVSDTGYKTISAYVGGGSTYAYSQTTNGITVAGTSGNYDGSIATFKQKSAALIPFMIDYKVTAKDQSTYDPATGKLLQTTFVNGDIKQFDLNGVVTSFYEAKTSTTTEYHPGTTKVKSVATPDGVTKSYDLAGVLTRQDEKTGNYALFAPDGKKTFTFDAQTGNKTDYDLSAATPTPAKITYGTGRVEIYTSGKLTREEFPGGNYKLYDSNHVVAVLFDAGTGSTTAYHPGTDKPLTITLSDGMVRTYDMAGALLSETYDGLVKTINAGGWTVTNTLGQLVSKMESGVEYVYWEDGIRIKLIKRSGGAYEEYTQNNKMSRERFATPDSFGALGYDYDDKIQAATGKGRKTKTVYSDGSYIITTYKDDATAYQDNPNTESFFDKDNKHLRTLTYNSKGTQVRWMVTEDNRKLDCFFDECWKEDMGFDTSWNSSFSGSKVAVIEAGAASGEHAMAVAGILKRISGTNSDVSVFTAPDQNKVMEMIRQAATAGYKVINLSLEFIRGDIINWGAALGFDPERAIREFKASLQDAVDFARNLGATIVASAGNQGQDFSVLAELEGVVSVGATDLLNRRASWTDSISGQAQSSGFGQALDFMATGYQVWSGVGTKLWTGTSFAAPMISGMMAGLSAMQNAGNFFSQNQMFAAMQSSAKDLGSSGWDKYFGYGKANAGRAIRNMMSGVYQMFVS